MTVDHGSSERPALDARRVAPYAVVAATVGLLAVMFVRALPSAAATDRSTPCRELEPTMISPKLGHLPLQAPSFSALDYQGNPVELSSYRGKVVFLNFWQTHCEACIREMGSMEALQQRLLGDDFVVLAMASEQDFAPVREFFPRGTSMTVLLDTPPKKGGMGHIGLSWGTEKWPETYLIDKDGVVRYYFINWRDWSSPKAYRCMRSLLDE